MARLAGSVRVAAVPGRERPLLVYDGDRYRLFHDRFRHFLVGERPDPLNPSAAGAAR